MLILCHKGSYTGPDRETGELYVAKENRLINVSESEGQYLLRAFPEQFKNASRPLKHYGSPETLTDIIVPTHKNEDYTIRCFEAIKRCTKPDTYKILWVDGGSASGGREKVSEVLRGVNHKKIFLDKNVGFVKATNAGLRESKAPTVCFLNNDTIVPSGWLERLTSTLLSFDIGIIGAMSQPHNLEWTHVIQQSITQHWEKHQFPTSEQTKKLFQRFKSPTEYEDWARTEEFVNCLEEYNKLLAKEFGGKYAPAPNFFVAFYCAVLRREVIDEVGLLNEEFGVGFFDDCDYCEEATIKGFPLAVALDVMIYHRSRATFDSPFLAETMDTEKELNKNYEIYLRNKKKRHEDNSCGLIPL